MSPNLTYRRVGLYQDVSYDTLPRVNYDSRNGDGHSPWWHGLWADKSRIRIYFN